MYVMYLCKIYLYLQHNLNFTRRYTKRYKIILCLSIFLKKYISTIYIYICIQITFFLLFKAIHNISPHLLFFLGLHKSIMHVHCTYYISFSMYIELPVTSKQFATDSHYHLFDIIQLHSL